ncbi:cupredoxin domain-containing protein [Ectobacillus funiculus]|uniref:Cupredoxin domain-containing protein n=1 Tax=Ectobacillus funiculus TaxID=137993 RepID=A0ABV5WJP8_9BACI
MIVKKWSVLLAVSVLMVVMLSACGSSTKQTKESAASANQTTQSTANSESSASTSSSANVVDIKVMAKDFEYDKKEIHVKKGDTVKITLTSNDGGHGFAIPAFNVDIQGNGSATFTADKAGTYEYHCSVMCGSGHANMMGKLIVE